MSDKESKCPQCGSLPVSSHAYSMLDRHEGTMEFGKEKSCPNKHFWDEIERVEHS